MNTTMTCESFDDLLEAYLEGELDLVRRTAADRHKSACARCAGLVGDIEMISMDAGALPDLAPERDLWSGVSDRIAAPVVALGGPHVARAELARPAWLAAAGLLLVAGTSAITFYATQRSLRAPRTAQPAAEVAQHPVSTPPVIIAEGPDVEATPESNPESSRASVPAQARERSGVPAGTPGADSRGSLVSSEAASVTAPEAVYSQEIRRLQRALAERTADLDPKTIAVIEANMRLIDDAIRSSRAALARDPASGFLNEQLTHALDKKVELLRTVALLPAST